MLEQQWGEKLREEMKGARELVNAILKYRNVMESDIETLLHIPVIDTRDEDEGRTDRTIQSIGHRLPVVPIFFLLGYLHGTTTHITPSQNECCRYILYRSKEVHTRCVTLNLFQNP